MQELANALKLLGDDTRLRILRLLAREPLNVSEVTSILGLAQSGISRHLSLLRKAGLVEEQREGVWTYYRIPTHFGWRSSRPSATQEISLAESALDSTWSYVRERLNEAEDPFGDLPRLTEVLRQRENYGGGLIEKLLEPGQSWFAWSRALHFMLPRIDAIDLGCGDGTITVEIGRFANRVVGIDANPAAIAAAGKRLEREHLENVEFRVGMIEDLKDPRDSYDLAIFSQSLHHMDDPAMGIQVAARLLRPGGRLLVVDLAPHNQEWVREKLGHRHLGFAPDALTAMFREAGLGQTALEAVMQRRGEAFRVMIASGIKQPS